MKNLKFGLSTLVSGLLLVLGVTEMWNQLLSKIIQQEVVLAKTRLTLYEENT